MSEQNNKMCDQAEMYALGGLSQEDALSFETHLSSCKECAKEVEELREIVGLLPLSSTQVDPPAGMKQRVLGNIVASREDSTNTVLPRRKQKKWMLNRIALSGLSAAVMILGIYSYLLTQNVNQLEYKLAEINGPTSGPMRPNDVVRLSPGTEDIVSRGLATIVVDQRGTHLIVQAEKMPELKGTEAYQVWLIKGEQPHNAGTFLTHQGTGALYLDFEPEEFDVIAITLEPDASGVIPRGEIILSAALN